MSTKRKNRLSKMSFDFVSLVARGDDPMAQVVISKADPTLEDNVGTIKKDDLSPEVVEYIEGLESEVDDLTKALADSETENEELQKAAVDNTDDFDTLIAKADPAVAKLLKSQKAALEKQETIAKEERDARLDAEFISKAEKLPLIGAKDSAEFGGLLRRVSESISKEDATALEALLGTAHERIAKGALFAEFGRGDQDSTISKSVTAAAEAIRKDHPEMTIEQATVEAYSQNPDLFAEAEAETLKGA